MRTGNQSILYVEQDHEELDSISAHSVDHEEQDSISAHSVNHEEQDCITLHSVETTSEGTQSSQHLSQISNWSDDMEANTLQYANRVIQLASRGQCSPLRGQLRTDMSKLKDSTKRYYKRKAIESVDSLLNLIAPGQSGELKKIILPESTALPTDSELTTSIIKLYRETTDSRLRTQILSIISRKLTKQEILQHIPDLTIYKIDQARLLSRENVGITIPEKIKRPRNRMNPEKLQHAVNFFFDPSFVQIVSYGTRDINFESGEKMTIPNVVRTACHSHMIKMYETYCKENDFEPLGRSSLFHILRACPASQRKNLHGLDNIAAEGEEGFQSLQELLDKLHENGALSSADQAELRTMLTASKIYMKSDYKIHIQKSDMCADHCINWSLSDPNDENMKDKCSHIHHLHCDRCQLLKDIESKIKSVIEHFEDTHILEEYNKRLSDALLQIYSWKSHIMRTVNQDRFRISKLESLEPQQSILVMDWAMKFLPLKYREKQTDWFGQRGKNWHVTVCLFKDADDTISVGMKITHFCYSEPQAGKSYCDSKIAHMRMKMKTYVAAGNNITTASDMKHALDSGSGVTGCQVSNVQIDTSKQKLKTHKLKGITNYNEVEVTEDGLILRKSYGIGKGYLISYNDIDSLASGKQKEHESGCVVIEPFTIPPVCKGKIKMAKNNTPEISNEAGIIPSIPSTSATDSISELFYCPEVGCVKKYATYKGLDDHVLCGKHSFHLENKSTYDKIKEQWAALCNDVVITCKSLSSLNDSVEKVLNAEPMGWALKKGKKSVRFSEKVKDYLSKKFMDGEKNGKKANPTEVSEEMKIMRDGNGKRVFLIEEWLNATQITSFFSRSASKGVLFQKSAKQEKIDDDDLVAALTALDEQDLMANLMD